MTKPKPNYKFVVRYISTFPTWEMVVAYAAKKRIVNKRIDKLGEGAYALYAVNAETIK